MSINCIIHNLLKRMICKNLAGSQDSLFPRFTHRFKVQLTPKNFIFLITTTNFLRSFKIRKISPFRGYERAITKNGKKSGLNGIRTLDLCDTGAMRLSCSPAYTQLFCSLSNEIYLSYNLKTNQALTSTDRRNVKQTI